MNKTINACIVFFALFLVLGPHTSYAYFDPGTGSYILQIVAATFFAGIFIVKMGWRHMKDFFSKLFKRDGKTTSKKEPDKE